MTPELFASWTTAGATILLAVFAFLAWRASAASLESMQNQERDSNLAVQTQIDDQNWGRQVESLANYTSALVDLLAIPGVMTRNGSPVPKIDSRFVEYVSARGTDEIGNILARIQSTGLIWRMHHARQTELIWQLEGLDDEVRYLGAAAIRGDVEWQNLREATGILLNLTESWQEAPEKRETTAKHAESSRIVLSDARAERTEESGGTK